MNLDVSKASLIGLDWGTSSLRAFLIDKHGAVLDRLHTNEGIMQVTEGDFEGVLARFLQPWDFKHSVPLIASGMITSRNGWVETPYLPVPTGADQLAEALIHLPLASGALLHFVTGVLDEHEDAPDVMRGEETQIAGAVEAGLLDGICVMPGTHSKWVTIRSGRIVNFETVMTGEVFEALHRHTILGKLMKDGEFSDEGFREGVTAGLNAGQRLLHSLFRVRTLPLFEKLDENKVADYLSGMLIGAEINSAVSSQQINGEPITIIGREDLAKRYAIALQVSGYKSTHTPEDIVARGHFGIAKAAGLLI